MGDMDIPKIFSNSYRAKKILPNYDEQFLQAISLARYYQDPPAELLGLWADPNQISVLQLNLHEFQSKVSDSVLLQHLEAIVVDHVSYTGIDLNLVKDHAHLRSPLQFVPGLGPVKAFALIDRILKRGEPITMRYDIATRYNKIITTVVYENSIAYIRLSNRAYAEEREELDTTRIHPEHYELARHVASSALDLDPNDETSIEEIMKKKNLDQLSNLDLKSYAAELNETGQSGESKTNYELLLNFICDEFRRPFRISRDSFREMKPTDALYKCSGEMPTTLAEGLIVNAVILKGQAPEKPDDIVTCRLESGLVAQFESSGYRDADVKEFFRGQQVVGRVKKIAVDYRQEGQLQYRINLSAEPSDLADHKRFVSDSMLDPAFKIDENDWIDKSNIEESKAAGQKYVPRRVNHPKYKNIGFETACSFLHSKEVGDLVFRPSSRGQDHLTCTWKFFEGIYSHLDIIEEGKPALNMLGSQFHIREESYDSLQEIADRYVLNCEKLVKEVIAHPRFLFHPRGLEAVEAELRQLKRQQPQKIHYLLTVSPQYPQFFILLYIPKDDVKHEYMKVKPKGLYFHELFHQSIHYLLTWFKKHYTTSSYQKDLKATRAPHMDCTPNFAIPGRFRPTGRMTPSREDASGTPSRYRPSRGYESPGPDVERPRHRSRRPPDRSGGIKRGCYKCGDPDHMARDCPQGDDAGGDRRPRERDSRPRACYNCGEEGHISRDCPRERNERSDRRGGDRGSGRSGDRGGDRDHRRSRDHSEPPVEERWTSTPAAIFDEPVGPTVWSDPSAQPEEPTGWNTTPRVPEATEEPNPWPINN